MDLYIKEALTATIFEFNKWMSERCSPINTSTDDIKGIFTEYFKRNCKKSESYNNIVKFFKPNMLSSLLLNYNQISHISFCVPNTYPSRIQREFINSCNIALSVINFPQREVRARETPTFHMSPIGIPFEKTINNIISSIHNFKN